MPKILKRETVPTVTNVEQGELSDMTGITTSEKRAPSIETGHRHTWAK